MNFERYRFGSFKTMITHGYFRSSSLINTLSLGKPGVTIGKRENYTH